MRYLFAIAVVMLFTQTILAAEIDIEMVDVPGGCFKMGDTFGDGLELEKPAHDVCVSNFSIGKYEVTQGQWLRIMGKNPSHFNSCGDDCPVEMVSWNEVQEFINKLNNVSATKYRLPTEAEWEYACRSGGKNEKFCGSNNVDDMGWCAKNSAATTHHVGQKQPNGFGIYDMSGNVWEMVSDLFGNYSIDWQQDPTGPLIGFNRVSRGGGWSNSQFELRATSRKNDTPFGRGSYNGFRLVSTGQ